MSVCDPWTTELELTACGCPDSLLDSDHVSDHITAASEWLHEMTGERFGVCTTTERPCKPCGCQLSCVCTGESILELEYGPIVGTPTVTVDGAAVTSFYVLPPNRLVRTDDEGWPSCQSLTSGEGTVVTYDHGETVPMLARLAASDLTIHMLGQCEGGSCGLPAGTTSVNRRGVTIQRDPKNAGRSLTRVAMLLEAYPRYRAGISRVDRDRGVITVTPA